MNAARVCRCWLPALALWAAITAWGQTVPSPITGEMPAAGFGSAGKLTNLELFSFTSSSTYDDNLSNSASQHQGGAQQYLAATFGFQQTRRRLRWNLSYRPGVVVGAHSLLGNQFNQVFGTTLQVQPTARWSLKLRQDYALTTNPFDGLTEAPLQPALGPLDRPNQLTLLPPLRRTASFTGAAVSYRLSRHNTVGLNGSYALQNYSDYGAAWAGPLVNNRAATASSYFSRQLSRRSAFGVEYRLRRLTFPGLDQRALTHSVLSFYQFSLTANSSIVVYTGPEYARTRGQTFAVRNAPAHSASWSPAAGAMYIWSGIHNRLQAGYSRQVSDGGGLQGPVRLNAGWLRVGRQLGRRWTADLGAELAQQTALAAAPGDRLRLLRCGPGFRRELGRNAVLLFSYDRLYQAGGSPLYRRGNHNRVALSIEHSFMRPWGR
ncbi:MAG TPA: hypothetical protein VGR48_08750 [Terriglobales bacterium]|nr:hypothetical protein [Terriglobales bacterium]